MTRSGIAFAARCALADGGDRMMHAASSRGKP
jgi:hypothetical protein